jgi:uncharacterized membrane protein
MKSLLTKSAVTALLGMSAAVMLSTAASAAVVCNAENECWHVKNHYTYKPEFGLTVHEDGWKWGDGEKYTWREHEGRGYWRNGVWVTF